MSFITSSFLITCSFSSSASSFIDSTQASAIEFEENTEEVKKIGADSVTEFEKLSEKDYMAQEPSIDEFEEIQNIFEIIDTNPSLKNELKTQLKSLTKQISYTSIKDGLLSNNLFNLLTAAKTLNDINAKIESLSFDTKKTIFQQKAVKVKNKIHNKIVRGIPKEINLRIKRLVQKSISKIKFQDWTVDYVAFEKLIQKRSNSIAEFLNKNIDFRKAQINYSQFSTEVQTLIKQEFEEIQDKMTKEITEKIKNIKNFILFWTLNKIWRSNFSSRPLKNAQYVLVDLSSANITFLKDVALKFDGWNWYSYGFDVTTRTGNVSNKYSSNYRNQNYQPLRFYKIKDDQKGSSYSEFDLEDFDFLKMTRNFSFPEKFVIGLSKHSADGNIDSLDKIKVSNGHIHSNDKIFMIENGLTKITIID